MTNNTYVPWKQSFSPLLKLYNGVTSYVLLLLSFAYFLICSHFLLAVT